MQNVNILDVSCTYYTHIPRNMCIVRISFMLQAVYKYARLWQVSYLYFFFIIIIFLYFNTVMLFFYKDSFLL